MSAHLDRSALMQEWVVAHEHHGSRADIYLSTKIGRLSRTKAKRIIEAGDFRKRDELLRPSQVMHYGEIVRLWRLPPEEEQLDMTSVGVVFEDNHWLVVNKPPDLAIHPTARYLNHTLTGWLKYYAPGVPVHPCHRLDRETSGIVMCAKHRKAERTLKIAFQNGEVRKTYLAVVAGHLATSQVVDAPLALQGERGLVRIRMIVDEQEGLPSLTIITPLAYDSATNRTLVKCEPKTGRQHQIRAHLAHIGHAIVGDKLYAMGDAFFDAYTRRDPEEEMPELEHNRHALHAFRVAFEYDGRNQIFTAPVPADFSALLSEDILVSISAE